MLLNHTKNDYEFIFGMHATAFANKDNNLLGTIYGTNQGCQNRDLSRIVRGR